mgnify:CR=1 FL=1
MHVMRNTGKWKKPLFRFLSLFRPSGSIRLCGLFEPGFALVIIFCCYKFCFICFSISIQSQSFFIRSPFVFIIMILWYSRGVVFFLPFTLALQTPSKNSRQASVCPTVFVRSSNRSSALSKNPYTWPTVHRAPDVGSDGSESAPTRTNR